ncbi:MAG: extracellular solute-binding protein [Pseudonocardiales bacterium]|nr:extracellular solute-binding protein [Pseudonocardiales bacterium]
MNRTRPALLILTALALTSCSSAGGSGAGTDCDPAQVTLTTAYTGGKASAEAAKEVMEQRYPGLTVENNESVAVSYDELTQQVVADIAAGREVDIVQAGNSQLRFYVDTFAPEPLDEERLLPTYDRDFLDIGTVDGEVYMAPFQVSVPSLFYNKDLMAAAGLDPESPPATYSELFDAARALDPITEAAPLYVITESAADWIAQAAVQSAGGTFVTPEGTPGFDTAEGREGLELYALPAREGLMDPVGVAEGKAAFVGGATAFYVTSSANAAPMVRDVGDRFAWGMTAMPVPDGGEARFPAGGNGWLSLTDDPCESRYASEFIGELLEPTVLLESFEQYSYLPVDTSTKETLLADPALIEPLRFGYSYDPAGLTPWGGWPGDTAPEANQILTEMTQALARRAPLDATVTETAASITTLVSR